MTVKSIHRKGRQKTNPLLPFTVYSNRPIDINKLDKMTTLQERVKSLNALLIRGETVKAMELFYAEDVSMQENEEEPRRGKEFCIAHERKNLGKVKDFQLVILNQAIDDVNEVVFTEMEVSFTIKGGPRMKIVEIGIQHWKGGLVSREKFYYKEVMHSV